MMRLLGLGDAPPVIPALQFSYGVPVTPADVTSGSAPSAMPSWLSLAYRVAVAASAGLSAYHGYKRNNSIGWAVGWGLLGGIFPVITPAVAFAQGFAKRRV